MAIGNNLETSIAGNAIKEKFNTGMPAMAMHPTTEKSKAYMNLNRKLNHLKSNQHLQLKIVRSIYN